MNDLTTTTILLVIGVVILWMAITDKLSRLLDAWDVATGKTPASDVTQTSNPITPAAPYGQVTHFALPSLPTNMTLTNAQVPPSYYTSPYAQVS